MTALAARTLTTDATQERPCRSCATGAIVVMLDADGTRPEVSRRPSVPSHVVDEYFWPCPNWIRADAPPTSQTALIQLVREAFDLLTNPESQINLRDWTKAAAPVVDHEHPLPPWPSDPRD